MSYFDFENFDITQLTAREIAAIGECLRVLPASQFIKSDFEARLGATRATIADIGTRWPRIAEQERIFVHQVLNECVNGMGGSQLDWDRAFSESRDYMATCFDAWKSACRVSAVSTAVDALRNGGVVAFPTETVYGLGADATNEQAIARIFQIKGRPSTNPLIVHVAGEEVARRYAMEFPIAATKLVARFWPGPLTIVLPKSGGIVHEVTAGLDTVGLRAPDHPLALELLRAFGGALAGPSANKSSHVSPTTAQHVRDELGDEVDLILDGGPCRIGIESTVLSLVESVPTILRPGAITREMIEEVLGERVEQRHMATEVTTPQRAPGQFEKHYAPRTPAFRFDLSQRASIDLENAAILEINLDSEMYARNFYARLRMLDRQDLRAIYIEMPPDAAHWAAVRDRIVRATKPLR